uniref:Uncharacterized protein n=1 Tax=Glossina austeni TaxID=7395 RepID=A0A1A9VEM7_GLOAU
MEYNDITVSTLECGKKKSYAGMDIRTMQFPVMATNNIIPKTMAQIVFCSQGNSYGRVGEGNKHSAIIFVGIMLRISFDLFQPCLAYQAYLAQVDFYNNLICSANPISCKDARREKFRFFTFSQSTIIELPEAQESFIVKLDCLLESDGWKTDNRGPQQEEQEEEEEGKEKEQEEEEKAKEQEEEEENSKGQEEEEKAKDREEERSFIPCFQAFFYHISGPKLLKEKGLNLQFCCSGNTFEVLDLSFLRHHDKDDSVLVLSMSL